jgi:hypothetical protein
MPAWDTSRISRVFPIAPTRERPSAPGVRWPGSVCGTARPWSRVGIPPRTAGRHREPCSAGQAGPSTDLAPPPRRRSGPPGTDPPLFPRVKTSRLYALVDGRTVPPTAPSAAAARVPGSHSSCSRPGAGSGFPRRRRMPHVTSPHTAGASAGPAVTPTPQGIPSNSSQPLSSRATPVPPRARSGPSEESTVLSAGRSAASRPAYRQAESLDVRRPVARCERRLRGD